VKAFVGAITFFPIGSIVRTSREETAVVVAVNPDDPLHPAVTLIDETGSPAARVDTSERDAAGVYARNVMETLPPPDGFDVRRFLDAAA